MLRRELGLFGFLLLAHLIVLSAQARDPFGPAGATPSRSLLRGTALRVFGPVLGWSSQVDGFFGDLQDDLMSRRTALRRLEEVQRENAELRRRNAELSGARAELESLQRAMGASVEWHEVAATPADVIYAEHRPWRSTVVVRVPGNPDEAEAEVGAPVVHHEGLVGRIVDRAGPLARVLLVTDRAASVGVMIERTRRQAVLRGATGSGMELQYVPLQEDVRPGDRLVTAGIDGAFPRGLLVGTVVEVSAGDELFHEIAVTPAVDLTRLERVFVLPPVPSAIELIEESDGGAP